MDSGAVWTLVTVYLIITGELPSCTILVLAVAHIHCDFIF